MTETFTASVAKGAGPTIVTIPCFSGAPWNLETTDAAGRLAVVHDGAAGRRRQIEAYADHVADQVADLEALVLVGDRFGAVVALAVAVRRPRGLRGLVVSGGSRRTRSPAGSAAPSSGPHGSCPDRCTGS
jgi:pimeloyl-ACP methyl ester carboxylesterase